MNGLSEEQVDEKVNLDYNGWLYLIISSSSFTSG